MSVKYLGKVNNIITAEELSSICGIESGVVLNSGDIYFLKFVENDTTFLVSSKTLRHSLSWDYLNSIGCVFGKTININNIVYKVRLLKGANGDEWDKFIVSHASSSSDSWWSNCLNYCQEDSPTSNLSIVSRGKESVSYLTYSNKSAVSNALGWRPVLEVLKPLCKFSIESSNIGYVSKWSNMSYSITGDSYSISEKLDGVTIRTLENQESGTEHTLDLSLQWDNLSYGKHTIDIIATDTNGLSSTVTITFNKAKEPITTIPTTSSLKQTIAHNKEIEKEIDYQCFKLENILNEKGLDLNPSDKKSLSSLIYAIRRVMGSGSILTLDNMTPTKSAGFAVRNVKAPSSFNIHPVYYDEIKGDLYSTLLMQQDQSTTYFIKQDKEGAEVWRFLLSGSNSRFGKVDMFMYKGSAILITMGKIYKIDLDTQDILQSFNITINDNMCYKVYNNKIYLITSTGILSYDLDTFEMIASIGGLKRISAGTAVAFLCDRIIICVDTSVRRMFDLDLNDMGTVSITDITTNNLMSIGIERKYAISVTGYNANYFDRELNIIKSVSVSRATAGTSALRLLYSNNELAIVMGGNYNDSRYEQYTLAIDVNGGSHMYMPHHGFSAGNFINGGEFGYLSGNEANFNLYRTKTEFKVI